jgi:Tol biopolymer transport system component
MLGAGAGIGYGVSNSGGTNACVACGHANPAGSARWCGVCGAKLPTPGGVPTRAAEPANEPRPDRSSGTGDQDERTAAGWLVGSPGRLAGQATKVRPDEQPNTHRRPRTLAIGGAVAVVVILVVIAVPAVLNDPDPAPVSSANDPDPAAVSSENDPDPAAVTPDDVVTNGWVALPVDGGDGDHDIYLAGLGREAFRVTGSDSDDLDELCPALSADGTRLAYGQAKGTSDTSHADGTLIVADVNPDGSLSEALRVETGPGSAPPCSTWSPAGDRLAVGVRNSADWHTPGDIWIVSTDSGTATVLEDRYVSHDPPASFTYSDMEWSPDGAELAVSGEDGVSLYSVAVSSWRSLPETQGARTLSWSPDGTRIVYEFDFDGSPDEIRVAEVDGPRNELLAGNYESLHGIGPVWSPHGDQIVYLRRACDKCRDEHAVVLVAPGGNEIVLPHLRLPGADAFSWPYRVTWSPDGSHLLYAAWGGVLIAVPLDLTSAPVVLYEGEIAGYGDGYHLASQVWGRGSPAPSN